MAEDTTPAPAKTPRKKAVAPTVAAPSATPTKPKPVKSTVEKVRESAAGLATEAVGAARNAANEGKDRASEALGTFSKVVDNAAEMVEEKIGPTYGTYARKAATGVSDFANTLQGKDIDDLIADTRNFVRKSPVVAIGAAAAIGFVLMRLAKLGGSSDDEA